MLIHSELHSGTSKATIYGEKKGKCFPKGNIFCSFIIADLRNLPAHIVVREDHA